MIIYARNPKELIKELELIRGISRVSGYKAHINKPIHFPIY
jgi:hypothetical protein